ncbi:hypothetical protein BOH78_5001 [Pichia kudriavzevii]|uniref:Uncharacterized protein n=2 Tax=Pichia kudriavzevii TaxID=4909 RepID=A0A1V2LF85_PICKU|nr:hypothetical protein BOH78_5447 [Pichia kudriavzevii]ONH70274.1 hypothetical protein BOH78_5358 [Pichia kudriavzevii]ONH70276.1 hypothetical protein BOH78_5355 [Pichia kudriavzevii]ONH70289.1 hypothetical protein BOH78_5342 [Pichia kudriavzevii]ONH70332.1 hypothetical protein BOH78_5299 [Pichia kudriavzevii]
MKLLIIAPSFKALTKILEMMRKPLSFVLRIFFLFFRIKGNNCLYYS